MSKIVDALETSYGCLDLMRSGRVPVDLDECIAEVEEAFKVARGMIWVCDLCGQLLTGAGDRCNSGLHQGPDDPNGWRGRAVEIRLEDAFDVLSRAALAKAPE